MRRAASVDANQPAIVDTFRKLGCSVLILSAVGKGCPDTLVGFWGINALVEIKDGEKPPSKRKLTPDEQEFHDNWKGLIAIVETPQDAIALWKVMRYMAQILNACIPKPN